MQFSLDVLRARKGDCLLLHFGSKSDPHLIIVDGGPSNVYKPQLARRIAAIRKTRKLAIDEPLPVEAVLISHVDDDHIKGILDLTRELKKLRQMKSPPPIRVRDLWHNSFDDFLDTTPEELTAAASFGTASLDGSIERADEEDFDTAMVLSSIPQGRDLRLDADVLKWRINHAFGKGLILAGNEKKPLALDGGLKLTVVGPLRAELQKLQKTHDKWLRDKKLGKLKDADAVPAAFTDRSVPNLSSIVLFAEVDGKTMLLTGDARGDKILEGLELTGLFESGKSKIHVDLLKVPHHGSANNVEVSFFQRLTADHYVFSGDGEHGNPERETLEMLFSARRNEAFTLHFTYPIDEIDALREQDWNKERAKEKRRGQKQRPPWSNQTNSLKALFESLGFPNADQKIGITANQSSQVIDLLDPIEF